MSFFRLRRIGSMILALCCLTFLPVDAQVVNQITKPVDVSVRHAFTNTVPLQIHAASDLGRVSPDLPMQDMVVLLQGSAAQSAALNQFIADVHNPKSPNYRQWLTPAEFGARFGASDQDVQTVSEWLTTNGFSVTAVARGKNWIRFSGKAVQAEQAFGTEVHQFSVAGKTYHANSTELSIPDALSPVVVGLVSLNDFVKPSFHTAPAKVALGQNGRLQRTASSRPAGVNTDGADSSLLVQPNFTSQGAPEEVFLAPGDFSRIYNTLPLVNGGTDGTGVSIAIVGRSDISLSDVETFRTIFGLPFNDPTFINANADPGVVSGDDEEAILDVEWSGAVAPKAKINYVIGGSTNTTDGVDISASYIVDNVTAPIMSVSFGECEAEVSPTESAFFNTLWQQAAAEGITVFVSAGDAGSSMCDVPSEYFATPYGLGVSGLASTPYNVAVGGTEFADTSINTYWNTTLNPDLSSAKGYVPEAVWNESCNPNLPVSADNCYYSPTDEGTYAGAGGASNCSQHPPGATANILTGLYACSSGYTKPSWQTGTNVPADGARDLPDVSLAAAAAHDGFLLCYNGSCQYTTNSDGSITLDSATIIGGTSAASPSMAGIMALVEQKNGSFQGLANYKFYQLAAAQPSSLNCDSSAATDPTQTNACVFHDITSGSNTLSCRLRNGGDCSVQVDGNKTYGVLSGNSAGAGYDMATGLGSVNAANLVSAWDTVTTAASNTSLTVGPKTFEHGTRVSVTSVVTPASGTGTPTGTLILKASNSTTGPAVTGTLTSGAFRASVDSLPGGTYSLTANYGGDGSYSASVSSPVSLTVTPEASSLTTTSLAPSRFFILGRQPIVPTTSIKLDTTFFLQVVIAGASGAGVPTGTVALSDGTKTFGTYPVSGGQIYVTCGPSTECDYPIGTYTFTATYSGDSSFKASTTTFAPFTITKGSAYYSVDVSNQEPSVGSTVIASVYFGYDPAVVPTGKVTLNRKDTGAVLATGTIGADGVATIPFVAPSGTFWLTASWPGDTNYSSNGLSEYPQIVTSGKGTTASTTTLATTVTTAALGQRSSFTITVKPKTATAGAPVPTGTVTLYTPTGQAADAINLTAGTVTTFYEWDLAGPQSLYATYSGDGTYAGSSSPITKVTVTKAKPTLTLTSLASYVAVGAQGSVTGSLTTVLSTTNVVAPSGSIQFYDSVNGATATAIGNPQALNTGNNNAILATLAPILAAGMHRITAVYSGDANWASVTSNPEIISSGKSTTATAITTAITTAALGQRSSFTITVKSATGTAGAPVPTGTVTLSTATGQAAAAVNLTAGTVTTFYEWGLAGPQDLSATYSGDSIYAGSSSPVTKVTVTKATPTLSLTSLANYVDVGAQGSVTASLTNTLSTTNAVAPSGSIQFYDSVNGATATAIGIPQALNAGKGNTLLATLAPILAAGVHAITAVYSGDDNWVSATSNPEIIRSGKSTTATAMTTTITTAALGQRSSFTITVKPATAIAIAGAPVPTGTVTLSTATGQAAAAVNLTAGTVTTFYEWGLAGPQSLSATYSGDSTYAGSSSPVTKVTVTKATPTLSLTSLASDVAVGAQGSVTGSLTNTLSTTNAVAPSGSIQFYDSLSGATATAIGTPQALNAGNGNTLLATFAPSLAAGLHRITAVYSGDANWASATSNPVVITAMTPDFTSVATPNPLTLGAGTSAVLSITTKSIVGYTGTVSVSCGGTLPVGVSCASTTIQSGATGTLTLTSVAPGTETAAMRVPHPGWLAVPGSIGFAGLMLLMLPRSRRFRQLPLIALILSVALASTLAGCAGGTTPKPTSIVLTSSSSKAASGAAVTLSAAITSSHPLLGTVTFFEGTKALGSTVTPSNGVASMTISTLAVGTHPLTAVYNGDSDNEGSNSSDVLLQTITGQFTLTVNETSGSLSHTLTVPVTLQ